MKKTDIVIIGSGIAGITASIYLKRANVDFVLLEGNMAGGMLNTLKTVENFPTLEKTTGNDILISLMNQLRFNNISVTYGNVQTILKEEDGFEVVSDVESYEAKAVIVATGVSQASKTIKGEEKYSGMGVSYCATCDGNFFKGLDVAVIGNNNIALEEALYLANLANKLYLICPDNELQGDKSLVDAINAQTNIEKLLGNTVSEIKGDDFGVTSLDVNGKNYEVAGVFPYVGKKNATQILNNLKPEKNGVFVKVDSNSMTNIPGLYAIGDIVDKKVRQLVTAAGDGANAATNAIAYLKTINK